jgi:plastocyanin
MRPYLRLAAAATLATFITVSCGTASAPAATKRTIYMTALEYKGSTEVAKEPFPTSKLPEGGGYIRKAPADGKWETSTYRWEPGMIVVYQGDAVELQIWGVNGAVHPGRIEGYEKTFAVKRGELTTLSFTADKAGVFRILCDTHNPSMTGTLVVLAR